MQGDFSLLQEAEELLVKSREVRVDCLGKDDNMVANTAVSCWKQAEGLQGGGLVKPAKHGEYHKLQWQMTDSHTWKHQLPAHMFDHAGQPAQALPGHGQMGWLR